MSFAPPVNVLNPNIQAAVANVDPTVVSTVMRTAEGLGIDPNLALAMMMTESKGDPRAVGDNGSSYGLFQLHQGGELGNLSPTQAFDPATNARVALTQLARVLQANPNIDPGQAAAMAQRPADRTGYASTVNGYMTGNSGGGATGTTGGMGGTDWTQMYSYASSLLGMPYVYGGTGNGGYDCSGFTQAVYAQMGIHIGRDTSAQLQSGQTVGQDGQWQTDISQLQPGDLIFYGQQGGTGPNAHVVMYIGNGQVIQAGGRNVNVTNLFQAASPNEPFLGVRRYTAFSNAPTGGASASSAMGPPGNTSAPSWNGQPLTMSDIPAVDDYIKANWGSDAWLLTIPEVKQILEQGAVNGWDVDRTMAKIEQTQWWQTTSGSVRQYLADKNQNPGDYTFTTPGSKASAQLAHIQDMAAKAGVTLTTAQAQQIATNSLMYGWGDEQTQAAIGASVNPTTGGNAQSVMQQINGAAADQFQKLSPQVAASWAQNIAGGTQTMDQFRAQMAQDAAARWTGYGPQLQQGMTMNQLTNSLRQNAAQTMEIDPNSIDFVGNPMYSKILDYVPANSPNGVHRVMTQSEMDAYLKSQPQWDGTQQARDQAANLATTITQAFGKMG